MFHAAIVRSLSNLRLLQFHHVVRVSRVGYLAILVAARPGSSEQFGAAALVIMLQPLCVMAGTYWRAVP